MLNDSAQCICSECIFGGWNRKTDFIGKTTTWEIVSKAFDKTKKKNRKKEKKKQKHEIPILENHGIDIHA